MAVAVNPYSESGIISTLRAKGIRTADITDENLLLVIEDALNEYLFYRPKVCITTAAACITTVAGTPNYNKPTGALWVKQVCYNPDYQDTDYEAIWTQMMLNHMTANDTTEMLIDYQKMAILHRYFDGFWEMRNDQIWLMPCPQGAYKVAVIYADDRTIDELDEIGDYRFAELCYWKAMLSVGVTKVTGGGFRAGQYSTSDAVGRETMRYAEKNLDRVRLQIANAYIGGRS